MFGWKRNSLKEVVVQVTEEERLGGWGCVIGERYGFIHSFIQPVNWFEDRSNVVVFGVLLP